MDFFRRNKDIIGIILIILVIVGIVWAFNDSTKKPKLKPNPEIVSLLDNIKKEGFIKGKKDARYTILEYTELLCPYCKRHTESKTLDQVIDRAGGEINVISRVFKVHSQAQKLEEALLCAQDDKDSQKYYKFLADVFAAPEVELSSVLKTAADNKYDKTKLKKCIDEGKYADKVAEQTKEGQENFNINGTPGNVIIDSETGAYVIVSGAYPVDDFLEKLETLKK